jgi:hypothetical protein
MAGCVGRVGPSNSLCHYLPTHALHCGPLVGQCCTRRDELRLPSCFTERGILSPVRTLCRQRAPSPRQNTKLLWLSRNIAVIHAAFRQHQTPSSRHAPIADAVGTAVADPSTRCPSPHGPSTRQFLRSHQHGRNRRMHYTNRCRLPEYLQPKHLPDSSPNPLPLPDKRTRKAVRRRCKAELLRDGGEEEALFLSPLNTTPPSQALTPQPPTPPPASSLTPLSPSPAQLSPLALPLPTPISPLPAQLSPLAPPSPTCATPNHPSPSRGSPLIPTRTSTDLALDAPPATGPPTPPPWPEAYVFSADPDRIVCRKCCNRHYNYRWYNNCFMCNGK